MSENARYTEEYKHLEQVNGDISDKLENLNREINEITKRVTGINKPSEVDLISLDIQKEKYMDINDVQNAPYFARMDFKFDGEEEAETIYLGKVGIEFNNQKNNIVDWRTPLGNIYYKGSLGQCTHFFTDNKGLMRSISGTKLLKRSIDIKDKKITKVQDLETLAETKEKELELADKYLIEVLKESSSVRLKDIIATIQETQNSIIREELNKIVFIQGCAGSGKSTIALHRIAYLLYYYNDKLSDEDILVIAPNKLFIEYISQLLPDLGAVNIKQETFATFVQTILKAKIDYNKQNIDHLNISAVSFNKGQLLFKDVIDNYIKYLLENTLPKKALSLYGNVLYSKDQLRKIFFEDFGTYKLNDRINKFKDYIEKSSQDKVKDYLTQKDFEYSSLIEEYKLEAKEYGNIQKEISEIIDEKEKVLNRIKRQASIIISEYLKDIKKVDALEKYTELINDKMILGLNGFDIIKPEDINKIVAEAGNGLNEDDLAGILYLYSRLNDVNKNYFKHIVIDESQDLSPFEVFTLRQFVYNNSFTIVGDVNQRIIPNKIVYDEAAIEKIFQDNTNFKEYKLNKSYRSSYEIMMFAKEILKFNSAKKEYLPDPIERHGERPLLIGKNSDNEIIDEISSLVKNRNEKYNNVAIVFRNTDSCKMYYDLIKDKLEVKLISEENTYNGGVCIFPAYLTKGFEFDMVIIGDCDDKSYRNNQIEQNLLYVQSTRAMHSLVMIYKATMSPLLLKIGKEYYSEKETNQEKAIKVRAAKDMLMILLKAKFGEINESIEKEIKEELNLDNIQAYITKAAMESNIDDIFKIDKTQEVIVAHEEIEELKKDVQFEENKVDKIDKVDEEFKDDDFYKELIDDLINFPPIEDTSEEKKYPYEVKSWSILNSSVALKRVDKTVFSYSESGIPTEISDFFEVEDLKNGRWITVMLDH